MLIINAAWWIILAIKFGFWNKFCTFTLSSFDLCVIGYFAYTVMAKDHNQQFASYSLAKNSNNVQYKQVF